MNTTLRKWFKNIPEPISYIYFFKSKYNDFKMWECAFSDKPISYNDSLPFLDIEFDSGYGAVEVPYFELWTDNYVYYRWEYDGSSGLRRVRRHPP